jgi:hypothetical protein
MNGQTDKAATIYSPFEEHEKVSGQLLELGMRYCNETWCLASLYEDPSWYCTWFPWGQGQGHHY